MLSIVRTGPWIKGRIVFGQLNKCGHVYEGYLAGSRRSAFTIVNKTRLTFLVYSNLTPTRRLSLKVKKSPDLVTGVQTAGSLHDNLHPIIDQKTSKHVSPLPTLIELDKQHFSAVTKEFTDSLSPRQLKTIEDTGLWKDVPSTTLSGAVDHYMRLSKFRLTSLVVLTTLGGFYMAAPVGGFDYSLLAATLVGTGLTSGSAAAWNHYLEVPFDSQMRRTQERPLVRGAMSSLHAASFAAISGAAGLTILATYVNPLTAILGGANLVLYSFIYTPMKRVHIANTWVGAIVGAIPPVMGFTAVTGTIGVPALLLGWLLYSWQFPHFNALSWNMRHDYARAGYRMMSVTNPRLCLNTALRHSLALAGCTIAMCATEMTHWSFGVDSLPFTAYLIYLSYKFRREPSSKTSRKLFLYSLIYLPAIMFLMVLSKNRNTVKQKSI